MQEKKGIMQKNIQIYIYKWFNNKSEFKGGINYEKCKRLSVKEMYFYGNGRI